MDVLLNYKFPKPFYSQSQLLELMGSISEATLKRYMSDWIEKGNDLKEMGYFRIDNVRENQFEPTTFIKWLYDHKINREYKYDYELKERDSLKDTLLNLKDAKDVSYKN